MRDAPESSGLLVVISGPSGAGKTTVVRGILGTPGIERAVTATTRPPREGETHGVDYVFMSREQFLAGVESGKFLEHAEVHGQLYGTPRQHVEDILARGEVCLLNVDVQGAAAIRGRIRPALFVFLTVPDLAELERRLRGRGTEAPGDLADRLLTAKKELEREGEYDVTVVNDDLDRAVSEIRERIKRECDIPSEEVSR